MRTREELLAQDDEHIAKCVEILDTNVAGNLAAMQFIRSRYRP
jgi:hypothetical protein